MSLRNITFILHKPQLSENIGACARALKNFNFNNLSIVNPKPSFPNDKIIATSVGAKDIVKKNKVNILCGHFEGVDQRVLDSRNVEEISIGDFILSGGEMASFVVLDTVLRLVPGVLGNLNSTKDESFENGLLEYPQYTKPQIWEKLSVPDILLSGDHNKIKSWRLSQSEAITRHRRPDLWQKYKKD